MFELLSRILCGNQELKGRKITTRSRFFEIQEAFAQYEVRISAMKKSSPPHFQDINWYVLRNEAWEPFMDHGVNCASCFGLKQNLSFSGFGDVVDFNFLPETADNILIWLNWNRLNMQGIDFTLAKISQAVTDGTYGQIYVVPPSNSSMKTYEYVMSHNNSIGINWMCTWFGKPTGKVTSGYYKSEIAQIIREFGINLPQMISNTLIRGIILDFRKSFTSRNFTKR